MVIVGFLTSTARMFSNLITSNGSSCKRWRWDVSSIINPLKRSIASYAILILNRPIPHSESFLTRFWNNAQIRITIDGGTSKWDNYLNGLPETMRNSMKDPDIITGDFDSINDDTLNKFKKKGCKVVHTPDQMYTDFTKALMVLSSHCKDFNINVDHVIAIGQTSGRIDQTFGNIQTLFQAKSLNLMPPDTRLYLLSDDALSWLLSPGEHLIDIPEEARRQKRAWCSLIPVGGKCEVVTTRGLKWNLDNQPLAFGELVSTSNTFDGSEVVQVSCSHPLLWSMKLPSLLEPAQVGQAKT